MSRAPRMNSSVTNCHDQETKTQDYLCTHANVMEHANQFQVERCIADYITGNVKFD